VIGDRAGDDFELARLTRELEVLLGQLPRAFDRFAAAGGEEHPVKVAGGVTGDARGEFDRGFGGVGPQREELQCLGLFGGRLGQFLAAVAHLAGEQAGETVDVTLAGAVPDVHTLPAGDDRRSDADPVPGEVAPEVSVGLRGKVAGEAVCHRVPQLYCCLTSFR
jgi:hypothetical protein